MPDRSKDIGVGKSCLLVRWVDDTFFEEQDRFTIGLEFKNKVITVKNKVLKMQVNDTSGAERYRTVTATFYRNVHGMLLVFDMTNMDSFKNADIWLKEIRSFAPGELSAFRD